jgi:hypothetical protein
MERKEQSPCSPKPSADDSFPQMKLQKSGHGSKNITLRTEEEPLRKSRLVYFEA